MSVVLQIPLSATHEQAQRLLALQAEFARVCNVLAAVVCRTRIWNRVVLHHLTYRDLRQQFPAMGSQMVCNAIYSVSRHSRAVFQHPASPFNVTKLGQRPLPRLHFAPSCPVYFDRHTLSIKGGQLSMYTLDGRIRFQLDLKSEAERYFRHLKLREVVLSRNLASQFALSFSFSEIPAGMTNETANRDNGRTSSTNEAAPDENPALVPDALVALQDYLKVHIQDEPA